MPHAASVLAMLKRKRPDSGRLRRCRGRFRSGGRVVAFPVDCGRGFAGQELPPAWMYRPLSHRFTENENLRPRWEWRSAAEVAMLIGMPTRQRVASRFRDIRVWDGTQDRAFEELCFQLRDPTPEGVELIKTSPPDAGVEWYWRYPDGSEQGWQVKFIFATDNLLKAMRASLKDAAEKRTGLTALTFCIPYDLADDPSRARGKQARERYEEAQTRWKAEWPDVETSLLSAGDLLERLARQEHRGREWFFFGERILGSTWCALELEATIEDAGDRYTPEQNVELPIDRILAAVAFPDDFGTQLATRRDATLAAARDLIKDSYASPRWVDFLAAIERPLANLERTLLTTSQPPSIISEPALNLLQEAGGALGAFLDALRPVAWPDTPRQESEEALSDAERAERAEQAREASSAQYLYTRARKLEDPLYEFVSFLTGPISRAAEKRALFIEGAAGTGKTHLFCDVGQRLLNDGHPVVVMLGQRFRDASPWTTLARLLGEPNLSPDEIATALSASGEASGRRAAIFIDALNEASNPSMWSTELADMRRRLTATGWVGLAVSCRTTYLDLVEPANGRDESFVRVEHVGYRGREFEATAKIFDAHGIQQPRVPLLVPEFNNPLFLKLYCEGVRDAPDGSSGSEHLSGIFERFVDGRKVRVERELRLDRRLDVVGQATRAFAECLSTEGQDRVPYEGAHRLINGFAPHLHESPRTLLETMASEGLLAIERGWLTDRDELGEVVSFPYQRFSDHLVVGAMLDTQLPTESAEDVMAAFGPEGRLGDWLLDAPLGLVEALAVQLPERWGVELPDLFAEPRDDDHRSRWRVDHALSAFVQSTVLRNRSAFSDRTHELINEALNREAEDMADALITVAPDPEHPYNGARLHRFLSAIPMPQRDAYWTLMQYYAFGEPSRSLDRLIRWAARGPYPDYPAEVISLACVPLVWHLASPNRFGRDYTTKALASLLIDRPDVCVRLVDAFQNIDDGYVVQRLAAAILGAVTHSRRSLELDESKTLVTALVSCLIENDNRAPDVLTRDYIASLARWLRRRRLISAQLSKRASPPYKSKRPKTPRTKAHLESTYSRGEEREDGYGSLAFSALWKESDWSRYVVSGRLDDFLPTKLGDPVPPRWTPRAAERRVDKRAWRRFLKSLSDEQRSLLQSEPGAAANQLSNPLSASQRELLGKVWVPIRRKPTPRPMAYPEERAARFIFQRCIELGWSPERFGRFDSSIGSHGRDSHKPERFGKKYQWIALFELLARLADNFVYNEWGEAQKYEGAWQLRLRDIDPTLPPEAIQVDENREYARAPTFPHDCLPAWWSPDEPTFDEMAHGEEGRWAELTADLPDPEHLLRVVDTEGTRWLVVDGYHTWREDRDETPSLTDDAGPYRDLAILTAAVLIRRSDIPRLREWLIRLPDLARSLPDWGSQGIYEAFWSELPWECESYGYSGGWRRRGGAGKLPVSSAQVSLGYSGESNSRDCSLTEAVTADVPSKLLAELGGLEWSETATAWTSDDGVPRGRYRETDEGYHRDRVLLLEEDYIGRLLDEHGLALAIGMFCERRVFDSLRRSMPKALGWVDYVGHLLFDGQTFDGVALRPYERHGSDDDGDDKE